MATDAENDSIRKFWSQDLMEVLVRFSLIAFLVVSSIRIFSPFLNIMLWGLILAVGLYPLHLRIAGMFGGRQGASASALVLAGLLIIGVPTVTLAVDFVSQIDGARQALATDSVTIKAPSESVADWPVIGRKVYENWNAAATDLPAYLESLQPQLGNIALKALAIAKDTMGAVLLFLGALIVAGIIMTFGESGSRAIGLIFDRFAGTANGSRLQSLTTATIRSVATGVIGVAFIQALLLGVGFFFAGIPGAGLWALLVMVVGIMQLPALIISLPAVAYLWWSGDASTTSNIVWTVYLLVAGMADNVLKPLLLGRGVDAPMPVILLGALGGMVSAGIVGLFVGAVLLAVSYEIFMAWVQNSTDDREGVDQTDGGTSGAGGAGTAAGG